MADLTRLALSNHLKSKLDFYRKAGTLRPASFGGKEMTRVVKFINTTAAHKIRSVSDSVKDQVRRVLADSQANQLPFITAVNRIIGETDLDKGVFSSVRKRAAIIATNELHRARTAGMFAYAIDEGYTYFVWVSVLMKTTCELCESRHGKNKTWNTWLQLGIPPAPHVNCKCTLIPGRGIPIPRSPIKRTIIEQTGVAGRVLRRK